MSATSTNDNFAEEQQALEIAQSENRNAEEDGEPESVKQKSAEQRVSIFSFFPAFLFALFKDLMDFTLITSFPGIGTLLTICIYIGIIFLLFAFPKQRYKTSGNIALDVVEIMILLGFMSFEGLFFGMNLLPTTAASVYVIYRLEKLEVTRRKAKKGQTVFQKGLGAMKKTVTHGLAGRTPSTQRPSSSAESGNRNAATTSNTLNFPTSKNSPQTSSSIPTTPAREKGSGPTIATLADERNQRKRSSNATPLQENSDLNQKAA